MNNLRSATTKKESIKVGGNSPLCCTKEECNDNLLWDIHKHGTRVFIKGGLQKLFWLKPHSILSLLFIVSLPINWGY